MPQDLCLIKIGGSIITDIRKQNTPKVKEIDRLVKELQKAPPGTRIIVGHGSGSFAHVPAHKYKIQMGIINKNSRLGASITQDAAANLNRIVVQRMIKQGMNAVSFPPSGGAIARKGKIIAWDLKPLKTALENGFVPVVYGDVVPDKEQGVGIASTEEVFKFIASKLHPQKIVLVTDVDGLLDKDPKMHSDARLIKKVNGKNIRRLLAYAKGSKKVDVTGGMHTKLLLLFSLVEKSRATGYIINGSKKGVLQNLLQKGKLVGTKVVADS